MTETVKPQVTEKLNKLQAQYPDRKFRIAYSTIYEVRICEDCGKEILTMALTEDSARGEFCSSCRAKQDAKSWAELAAAGRECDKRIAMHMSMD